MSSNTLRGIGQEEDGAVDAAASGKGVAKASAGAATVGEVASAAGDLTEKMPDPRHLESTTPGTRSLDSSVPDARPSLDAKVPHLAATLMGVTAPTVDTATREKGTVQGRDVHLSDESRRLGGARPVGDDVPPPGSGPTPQRFDHSEPTRADPVRTAVLAQGADDQGGRLSGTRRTIDSNSHGPWYDQDPTGGNEVYEEEKPSVVGRAAIGVAVAAGLSVLVFGVLRMTANSDDGGAQRPPPVVYEPSASPPPQSSAPGAPASVAPVAAHVPAEEPPGGRAGEAPRPAGAAPGISRGATSDRDPGGSSRAVTTTAGPSAGSATARPTVVRVGPTVGRSGTRAVAAGRPTPSSDSSRGSGSLGTAVIAAPTSPFSASPDVVVPPAPASPAGARPTAPPSGTEKPRGKAYDPDSTLPLNLD